jgi:hypothetical protein
MEPDCVTHEYREAAKRFIASMIGCVQFLRDARDASELLMRLDIVSAIFVHPSVSGMSWDEIGKKHNRTRAAISAQVLNFQRANHLPPTLGQKSVAARISYSQTRKNKLITK